MNFKSKRRDQSQRPKSASHDGHRLCLVCSIRAETIVESDGRVADKRSVTLILGLFPLMLLTGCASAPVTKSGSLTSYQGLATSNSIQTQSQMLVNREQVLAANTARISPTRFAIGVGGDLSDKERELVANRVNRALCRGLSRRLDVVSPTQPADLNIQATITHLGTTNRFAAGASIVVGFIPSTLSSVPVLSPRVPFGVGSLTVEAEALNETGGQEAAMVWSRGASYVMGSATVSKVGDAYQLASDFGDDFSELVTTGKTPIGGILRVEFPKLGGKKDVECEAYGPGSGLIGFFGDKLGAPPEWTDKGARDKAEPERKLADRVEP